jgi:uncharacterized protein (UPF0303 family)
MNPVEDLDILTQQEAILRFPAFDPNAAWQLGTLLRDALISRDAGGSVEIELAGQVLFGCVTPGATPGQADWIRRKRNTVRRFARSTYAIGRMLERDGETLEARHGLSLTDYAAHGGGFPLFLNGTGMVGSIVLSGLPQRDDHNLVVTAMAQYLKLSIPQLPAAG